MLFPHAHLNFLSPIPFHHRPLTSYVHRSSPTFFFTQTSPSQNFYHPIYPFHFGLSHLLLPSTFNLTTLPTIVSLFILHIYQSHPNMPSSVLPTFLLFDPHISLILLLLIYPSQAKYLLQCLHLEKPLIFSLSEHPLCFTPIHDRW